MTHNNNNETNNNSLKHIYYTNLLLEGAFLTSGAFIDSSCSRHRAKTEPTSTLLSAIGLSLFEWSLKPSAKLRESHCGKMEASGDEIPAAQDGKKQRGSAMKLEDQINLQHLQELMRVFHVRRQCLQHPYLHCD